MESTTQTPRRAGGRARASGRVEAVASRDTEYDLLTAALIGVAIGVGTTLLLRGGATAVRSLRPAPSRGARLGRMMKRQVAGYAEAAGGYADAARERVDEMAEAELRSLRRAIRRRRKQLGI